MRMHIYILGGGHSLCERGYLSRSVDLNGQVVVKAVSATQAYWQPAFIGCFDRRVSRALRL